jgi:hypothetical protein
VELKRKGKENRKSIIIKGEEKSNKKNRLLSKGKKKTLYRKYVPKYLTKCLLCIAENIENEV